MNTYQIKEYALKLMKAQGLTDKGWVFSFNNALSYAGICYGSPRKEIQVSKPICEIESKDFIKDTIKHEVAHAIAGTHHGHDIVWQNAAKKLGCPTDVTYDSEACNKLRLSKTKYVMVFKDKIVSTYLRKPNRKTISNIKEYWARGFKEQTMGKLEIVGYNPNIHKEYM